MADWRQHLEDILGAADASASALDAEARTTAERVLAEASASDEAEALLQVLDTRFPVRGNGGALIPLRAYVRGLALLERERPAEAQESLLPACEKLEQGKHWADLGGLADDLLGRAPSVELARYLAKAAEAGGAEAVPEGSLERALDLYPDEHRLAWLVADQLEQAGDEERALALFIGCLPALIDARQFGKVEEVFLRLEEHGDAETVATLLHACVRLAGLKEWGLLETYLTPLLPKIKAAGLARQAWEHVIQLLQKTPAQVNLRRYLMDLAPEAHADVDGVLDLLGRSSILDPQVKVDKALAALAELLEFAPGYRVLHQSWGAGRIRVNEGDALIIDFAERPSHRMSLKLARSALQVIPADDLRVLWVEDPERVRTMARERPADLTYLAIRELGNRATAQQLRRRLTGEFMPTSRWSTWWKDARVAMETDERFDLSESFRQTYAIRTPGAGDAADLDLPHLDRRRGIRANLNLLRRFLEQYPKRQERAVRMYTPILTRWLREDRTNPEAAMAICLMLHRWERLDAKDLERSLRAVLAAGVEATAFAGEEDQRFLLSQALGFKGLARPAILFALGSRYAPVRELALEKMTDDPAGSEALLQELLNRPEERAQTAFSLINMTLSVDGSLPAFFPSPWLAAVALCRLVERTGRDLIRTHAMRLFSPESALRMALTRVPITEEARAALADELKRWRESERFLFPILSFFESLGLGELTEAVRLERTAATNRFLRTPQIHEGKYGGLFLSRETYTRLEKERDQLAWELKTTVAQAIQRAREMGDLSENAEYDAAKDKQARHARRISQINDMLRTATLIESVEVSAGEVGPGSWVEVRPLDAPEGAPATTRTYWLLGEGDGDLGPQVVSCSSAIGQALLGQRVGSQVEIELADGRHRIEILTAVQRMPEQAPAAEPPRA